MSAYDGVATGWDADAGLVYRPLAAHLLARSPVPLAGRIVIDVGTGTGAAADLVVAAGAWVLGVDAGLGMLAMRRAERPAAVAGDVRALPLVDGCADIVVAAFLLNHLEPAPALAELRRVLRPAGALLASTWLAGRDDPARDAVTDVLRHHGWTEPDWYRQMKGPLEQHTGRPAALRAFAEEAGFAAVRATVDQIDVGLRDPGAFVGYRLALPQVAPFVAALQPEKQEALRGAAIEAVDPLLPAWRASVLVLIGRAPGLRRAGSW